MGLLRFQYHINSIPSQGALTAVANPDLEVRSSVGVILRQYIPSVGPDLRIRIRHCLIDLFISILGLARQMPEQYPPSRHDRLAHPFRFTIIKFKSCLFPPRQIGRIVKLIAHFHLSVG